MSLPPFQTLLDAHAGDVHRFLVATVGRPDADDCYQETWLAALRAYPRLRDARNLRGWLFTIANRKAIDHIRARKRTPLPVGAELPAQAVEDERRSAMRAAFAPPSESSPPSSEPRSRCATSSTPITR